LAIFGAAPSRPGSEVPQLPQPNVILRIDAPDPAGPWRMVVTNNGDVPVRFAADGRLLSFEMPKPEDPYEGSTKKKKANQPAPVVCKLPPDLRPTGVVENRAVLLGPGARYEEVVSPAFYCFSDASVKALVPGATITAKLGFDVPKTHARKNAAPSAPFVVEPAVLNASVSAQKELVSEPFVLAAPASTVRTSETAPPGDDPGAPRMELSAPARVDTASELTVGMTLKLKNVGGRPAALHVRRDNMMFDIDGPNGSAHCGQPAEQRGVPRDAFAPLSPGASRTVDVWVGEMCSDAVFDRPGLYRVRPSLAFPIASDFPTMRVWTDTVTTQDPVLVRVREGRLPFYASPPQVFGAPR
jgi:hypothetical protein